MLKKVNWTKVANVFLVAFWTFEIYFFCNFLTKYVGEGDWIMVILSSVALMVFFNMLVTTVNRLKQREGQ